MTWSVGVLHETRSLVLIPICRMGNFAVGFSFLGGGGGIAVIGFSTYFDWEIASLRLSDGL